MPLPTTKKISAEKWALTIIALLVPLGFAAFTNHVWEDYYITLRSSRNLVQGHGLVFQPGERLHTFTSPLGVLLPALWLWLSGGNETIALWLFRLTNAIFLAAAVRLLWREISILKMSGVGRFVLFGLVTLDPKLIDFSINGQETALLVFFTVFLWTEFESAAGPRMLRLGIAYAGLMWTRPDAFVLAGAISLPNLVWSRSSTDPKRTWSCTWRAALLGAVLYIPWVLWAWIYYGSPVPHTIIAKATQTPLVHIADLALIPVRFAMGHSMFDYLFLPSNFLFGGWPWILRGFAHILTMVAAFAWLLPRLPKSGRRASLTVFLGMFYLCAILVFAWYVPPWTVLAAIALAFVADAAYTKCLHAGRSGVASIVRIACLVIVAVQAAVLASTAWQMKVQQKVIENEGRRAIGEWLQRNAAPHDTVFMEPLGYIGYFSQLKTYDFPGLSSREVVDAIRGGATRYSQVVARLKPTWLVLRPCQWERQGFDPTGVIPGYRAVRIWDARPKLDAVRYLPGRSWLEYDATFVVYRRVGSG